ncbi:MAG: 2-dehydropantoate 2-reductase [Ilumatobacteraceae bacterium]
MIADPDPSRHGPIQRIGVVGVGAMGGMYLRHFVEAGFDCVVAARGERARRLAITGLVVNGVTLRPTVADADAAPSVPSVDLAIVAVKHHQLDDALDDLDPLIGPDTVVLSVLNGLDSEDRVASRFAGRFGSGGVLLSIALAMDAQRCAHEIRYSQVGRIVLGEASTDPDGQPSSRVAAVQQALDRAHLAHATPSDMRHEMWWKFMVNVGINQASAVLRAPYGAFCNDGPARRLMLALIDEVVAIAAAEGIVLDDTDRQRWLDVLDRQPHDGSTSMHQDIEAGRPTEVEIFAGRVIELGRRHGIPTPVNQTVAWIIEAAGPAS